MITFWTQHTGPFLFYLYPLSGTHLNGLHEQNHPYLTWKLLYHHKLKGEFKQTDISCYRRNIVFIRLYIFVSEWPKKGADLNSTPCTRRLIQLHTLSKVSRFMREGRFSHTQKFGHHPKDQVKANTFLFRRLRGQWPTTNHRYRDKGTTPLAFYGF